MYTKDEAYKKIISNLWDYETRATLHRNSSSFAASIEAWNKGWYNSPNKVGKVMEVLNQSQPENRKAFASLYLNTVRAPIQVVSMVQEMSDKMGLTFEVALNWWWVRVLDMSFTGWENEKTIIAMIRVNAEGMGYKVRGVTDQEDREFGVDAIIYSEQSGTVIEGVQIKPSSYFTSPYASTVKAREVDNPKKYERFKEATGARVRYVVIEDSLQQGYPIWKESYRSFKTANRFEKFYK